MKCGTAIWMDGNLIPWDEATTHVSAHALHYGSSVFEGIRAYCQESGSAIFRLEEHVRRLISSCALARIDLPYTLSELSEAICETVTANAIPSCYIRPLVFRGTETFAVDGRPCPTHVSIMVIDMGAYLGVGALEKGVRVGVSSWRRMAPGTALSAAKIGGQYVNSQFIAMEAHDRGFDEAISLDSGGLVSEGSGENVFLIRDGVLVTPPTSASILEGITRNSVITMARELGFEVEVSTLPRDMLYLADEVFFTGTAAEITPIVEIDEQTVGTGKPGPITQKLAETFFGLVGGHTADRHGWLTHP